MTTAASPFKECGLTHSASSSSPKMVSRTVTPEQESGKDAAAKASLSFDALPKAKKSSKKRQEATHSGAISTEKEMGVDSSLPELLKATTTTKEDGEKEEKSIPLNPFLDDANALKSEDPSQSYTIEYRTPRVVKEEEPVVEETPVYGYGSDNTYEVQGGYGGGYSQSQYEAFMRRSGMLASASAATAKEANLLVSTGDENNA